MKILVIEDDSETAEFITTALNVAWPDVQIDRANCGRKGIELLSHNPPDVVLLDIGLPDTSGFEVLKMIRSSSNVPVIIETIRNSESDIVKGLNIGADEYIAKPFGQLELLARIRTVLKRFMADSSVDLSCGSLYLNVVRGLLSRGPKSVKLTPTEIRIMRLLLKECGKPRSFGELSEAIWGDEYPCPDNTIRVYIRRLRKKILSVSDGNVRITTQQGMGYTIELT